MKKRIYLSKMIIVLMAAALFYGCASIVSQSTYMLSVNSSPNDAKITVTNNKGMQVFQGNTPATVRLKASTGFFAKAEYSVRFSSPGYEDQILPVYFTVDGWYWGNILVGGLPGMLIIDPATGAMWKLETEFLNATLKQLPTANHDLQIMDIKDVPEHLKEHLTKIDQE